MSRGHGRVQRTILERLAEHARVTDPMRDFDGATPYQLTYPSFVSVQDLADDGTAAAREATRGGR
jgi:hypothetical protein